MIIDSFIFYNELELLYYRLNILYDKVDYFILVESTKTHKGADKPLYYNENKHIYKKFEDKIIHIITEDLKSEPLSLNEVWLNENNQRNSIDKGIQQIILNMRNEDLDNNDLIIISDIDEIPSPLIFDNLKSNSSLEQDFYYYNLHTKNKKKWYASKVVDYESYKNVFHSKPNIIRFYNFYNIIQNAGWHLSYFGDENFIQNKLLNFAHQEYNIETYTNINTIKDKINNSKDLFNRNDEQWEYIDINNNMNLPFKYNEFLNNYL